jgi:hypothetical protein
MPGKKSTEQDRVIDLLEKMLAFQLYALEVPQVRIARIVAKKTDWVNDLVKGISRKGAGKD